MTGFEGFDFQFATRLSFEDDLNGSRVYKRTQFYASDVSFTTSAIRTHSWSVFSGLSLAEVSVISAIALSLYLFEISNSQWYDVSIVKQNVPQQTRPIDDNSSLISNAAVLAKKKESVFGNIRDLRRRKRPLTPTNDNSDKIYILYTSFGRICFANPCLHSPQMIRMMTVLQIDRFYI
jgi:hypothetical protein